MNFAFSVNGLVKIRVVSGSYGIEVTYNSTVSIFRNKCNLEEPSSRLEQTGNAKYAFPSLGLNHTNT